MRIQLSFGAITNEFVIKRELENLRVIDWRGGLDGMVPRKRAKDTRLDSDRRLALFSYTPDTFSLILVPMITEGY